MSKMIEKVINKRTAEEMIDTMIDKGIKNMRNYKVIVGLQELATLLDETKMISNELATLINEMNAKELKELKDLNIIDTTSKMDGGDIIKLVRG